MKNKLGILPGWKDDVQVLLYLVVMNDFGVGPK